MTRVLTTALALVALTAAPVHAADIDPWAKAHHKPTRHTIKRGETLSTIADQHHTPGGAYRLAYVNRDRIDHPDLIEAGVTLRLPQRDGKRWVPPRPTPATVTRADCNFLAPHTAPTGATATQPTTAAKNRSP